MDKKDEKYLLTPVGVENGLHVHHDKKNVSLVLSDEGVATLNNKLEVFRLVNQLLYHTREVWGNEMSGDVFLTWSPKKSSR